MDPGRVTARDAERQADMMETLQTELWVVETVDTDQTVAETGDWQSGSYTVRWVVIHSPSRRWYKNSRQRAEPDLYRTTGGQNRKNEQELTVRRSYITRGKH